MRLPIIEPHSLELTIAHYPTDTLPLCSYHVNNSNNIDICRFLHTHTPHPLFIFLVILYSTQTSRFIRLYSKLSRRVDDLSFCGIMLMVASMKIRFYIFCWMLRNFEVIKEMVQMANGGHSPSILTPTRCSARGIDTLMFTEYYRRFGAAGAISSNAGLRYCPKIQT